MLEALIKILVLVVALPTAVMFLVLLERRMAAWIQDRRGPNRVGIPLTNVRLFGLGQPLADGLKFIFKEEYTPAHVDRFLYNLAPISLLAAGLATFAVIPFGSVWPRGENPIQFVVAPGVDVGIVYVFALSSIAVYGVILGGWASNNKYGFLGALRSSAQLIAYEVPLGLGILGVILVSDSLRLDRMIADQARTGVWNVFSQPIGFFVFLVAAWAEAARLPFDLPEAEQELVGGYHTEYAGMRLIMYATTEFLHMVTAAFLIVVLFLGGWHWWGLTGSGEEQISWATALVRVAVLFLKVFGVILVFMLVRWTWPRFRFDQLMNLAWKVMLPLGMVNLVLVAVLMEFAPAAIEERPWAVIAGMWAVAVVTWFITALLSPSSSAKQTRLSEEW
jgi:NADH-quinone oxidoreductase subunit H